MTVSRELARRVIRPCSSRVLDATFVQYAPGEFRVTARIDAFLQAKAHEQELVAFRLRGQHLLVDDPMAVALDPLEPGLRMLFRRGGKAGIAGHETPMRARSDARIFAIAPIDEVVRDSAPGLAWFETS